MKQLRFNPVSTDYTSDYRNRSHVHEIKFDYYFLTSITETDPTSHLQYLGLKTSIYEQFNSSGEREKVVEKILDKKLFGKKSSISLNEKKIPALKPKAEGPVLTSEEKTKVDDEKHVNYPIGARVFAIRGRDYYAAVLVGRDELGRYNVTYEEDGVNLISSSAVPINLIRKGSEVSVLGEKDDSGKRAEFQFHGKVLAVPSIENADEWKCGMYSIELSNGEITELEKHDVKWVDIFLTYAQSKQIMRKEKNFTELRQEYIIEGEEGKRTRRSKVATSIVATIPVFKSKSTLVSAQKMIEDLTKKKSLKWKK
uniref:Uncharacterized protein n=1 Tax=Panagrolaimus sp. JU765 TaxID=591449 RepID=A0AC34Q463_9BILA